MSYELITQPSFPSSSLPNARRRPSVTSPQSLLSRTRSALLLEQEITRRLLRSNFSAFTIPFYIVSFSRFLILSPSTLLSPTSLLRYLLVLSLLAVGYQYTFDIANQATSVDEDAANKPSRPIPAGLLSIHGAYLRWALSWALYPLTCYVFCSPQAAWYAISWEASVFFCYAYPKPNHWFFRNAFCGYATFTTGRLIDCSLRSSLPGGTGQGIHVGLDIAMGVWIFCTVHLQEFHDVEGDRKIGRKTLPIVLGKMGLVWLRGATAVFLVVSSVVGLMMALWAHWHRGGALGVCSFSAVLFGFSVKVARRVWEGRTPQEDERTYRKFYLPFAILLYAFQAQLNSVL